jgi:hypothetical protein
MYEGESYICQNHLLFHLPYSQNGCFSSIVFTGDGQNYKRYVNANLQALKKSLY